jgi:large subunit ribosomal protein L3
MKFILGTKENMTEYFSEDGTVVPVTVLSVPPVLVTRIFEKEKDGYNSVQVSFGKKKQKEFRLKPADKTDLKKGDSIDASVFTPGDLLQVSSISKSKGFQGVVKRHGFHGGPRSHGQKHSEREPGSIGGGLRTHVPKGMRMGGRMGGDRITQKNLKVIFVDKDNNVMLVKGAVAGRRGTLVEVIAR